MEMNSPEANPSALNLLIVEDDPICANVYRSRFERDGYHVEICTDGQAGFYRLHEANFSVVLLDLTLPQMSGIDILRKIRAQHRFDRLPVFVLTSSTLSSLVQEAIQAGATQVFFKGNTNPQAVAGVISAYLNGGISALMPGAAPQLEAPAAPSARLPTPHQHPQVQFGGMPAAYLPAPKPAAPAGPGPTPFDMSGMRETPSPAQPHPSPVTAWPYAEAAPQTAAQRQPPRSESGPEAASIWARAEWQVNQIRKALKIVHGLAPKIPNVPLIEAQRAEMGEQMLVMSNAAQAIVTAGGAEGLRALPRLAQAIHTLLGELRANPSVITPSLLTSLAKTTDLLAQLASTRSEVPNNLEPAVLVVDDDMFSRRAAVIALKKVQILPVELEDPLVAVQHLQKQAFDLVIADVNMPGMSGFELCKKIRENPLNQATPVIFITVDGNFERRAQSVLSGGHGFITKPYILMELATRALGFVIQKHAQPHA
jgi:CheY-like chemotaxis protein